MEECLVSLYCTNIESKTSIYLLVELAVKFLNIFSLIVRFHRSIMQDFSSFLVEYSSTSFWTSLLQNSFPLSTHSFFGFLSLLVNIFSKACDTDFPLLSFNGTIQPYLQKISTTLNKYLKPSLYFEKDCISIKSAAQILSMSFTADIFENFRDVCVKNYELDPAWYYTSPGLAWDAALKSTGINLELVSDYDMILMIKQGIRGGISTISNRYGKANNKYLSDDKFDSNTPSTLVTYADANNLYGWDMSKPLPTNGFKWISDDELNNWRRTSCILEVDLEYPEKLHDLHNDYPLAPESITLEQSDVAKLIPNLNDKKKYELHYENLKLYEILELNIVKIYRGIKFEESAWLKKYIDLNIEVRTRFSNQFEKDFFKLMNNSVFGKTLENIENHLDIKLVCDEKEAIKLSAKPSYDRATIFDENLIAVHMKRTKLFYNKPIYLGMCILDLSKTLMYDFHYNYILPKYAERARLLFTDTDSLAYEIQTEDFYKDIAEDLIRVITRHDLIRVITLSIMPRT